MRGRGTQEGTVLPQLISSPMNQEKMSSGEGGRLEVVQTFSIPSNCVKSGITNFGASSCIPEHCKNSQHMLCDRIYFLLC